MNKSALKTVIAVVLLVLLAFLIPSATLAPSYPSEGTLLGQNDPLLTVGWLSVTPYSCCMTLGAALAVVLTLLLFRKDSNVDAPMLCILSLPCALIGGHLVYCAAMMGSILSDYEEGAALIWQLKGGYTLYGAVLGLLLGLLVYAKATGRPFARLADAVTPGAAIALAIGRLGEFFIAQGLGEYVEDESLAHFPLLICTYADEDWSQWQIPVFFYEALAALVILAVVLVMLRRGAPAGRMAETFMGLLGVTQIFLESLRRDEFLRFGFVRFTQLAAAVTLAAVLFLRVRRMVLDRGWQSWQIARIVMFVLCVGVVIAIEFALDKSTINNLLLYCIMAVCQVVMGIAVQRDDQ